MVKKVVDVPEGAEEFLFEAYKNEMLVGKTQEGYVSSLPDAPTVAENATVEKRVIELPADLLDKIVEAKKKAGNLRKFLNWTNEGNNDLGILDNEITVGNYNVIADWYLGHVDFVPKKEPKFAVKTKFGYVVAVLYFDTRELGVNDFSMDEEKYTKDFNESEADRIVDGLGTPNGYMEARKVKVEE